MQLLFSIGRITERRAPEAYFAMDGSATVFIPTPLLERLPSARTGYTLATWIKVIDAALYPSSYFIFLGSVLLK